MSKSVKDNLGDRMKLYYENISRTYLTRRTPVIIRIDGKTFHTFTRGFDKPFSHIMTESMKETCKFLGENVRGCKLIYTQSDEINLLLTDYDNLQTSAWFDYNIQKLVSISASMTTLAFNRAFRSLVKKESSLPVSIDFMSDDKQTRLRKNFDKYANKIDHALFDSRAFSIPKEEVTNYFIWRQQDATRNSIESVGHANFSPKRLMGKSCKNIQDMLLKEKGIDWNNLSIDLKRGSCALKETYQVKNEIDPSVVTRSHWIIDNEIPIFSQNREYVESHIESSDSKSEEKMKTSSECYTGAPLSTNNNFQHWGPINPHLLEKSIKRIEPSNENI